MSFNNYGFQDVEYDAHYQQFAAPFLIDGNDENNRYFVQQAQENHVYGVNNALLEVVTDAAVLLSIVPFTTEAEHYFRYGVMRRLRLIDSAFKSFQSIIQPDRNTPLTQKQSDSVCRDLNAIYIDLLGLLDNYCWTLVHQHGSAATKAARPLSLGLFKPILRNDPELKAIAGELSCFAAWEEEVKTRRNPAAHRMPLYVPPAALTPEDLAEHRRLEKLASDALRVQDFELAQKYRTATWRLGTFLSKFLHDPQGPITDIYPTLPTDIGQALKIGRLAQTFLRTAAP